MDRGTLFDLPEFMLSRFNRVDFGGNLFGQWPVGIRFEIGIKELQRAADLFNFVFANREECILVSQDWKTDGDIAKHFSPLFKTPGIFPSEPPHLQSSEVFPLDETPYRLTWARIRPEAFNPARMFEGIAHREQAGTPKISSGVYIIDPLSRIIIHMYDDRGLDVIATELETLWPLFASFREWILDNQRHRVEFRFRTNSSELSE